MNLYKQYEEAVKALKKQQEVVNGLQVDIYNAHLEKFKEKREGTVTLEDQGYKITVVNRMNVTVDQKKAIQFPSLFTIKYGFSKREYDLMDDGSRKLVDDALTRKPGKPSFKVEAL